MAQAKKNFLASKMNKDKDARLIPPGEYREGRNINISKSEGADVGALENLLGNEIVIGEFLNNLQTVTGSNNELEVIGFFTHEESSSLYLFITSWRDNSSDQLSNGYKGFSYIVRVLLSGNNFIPSILVKGAFLNFSKTHPILGFNIIENLMFFSDNRNQPRKINITLGNTPVSKAAFPPNHSDDYYFCEDQISVAKYAPVDPILFIKNTGSPNSGSTDNSSWEKTWKAQNEQWLPPFVSAPLSAVTTANRDYMEFDSVTPALGEVSWPGTPTIQSLTGDKNSTTFFPAIKIRNWSLPNGGTYYLRKIFSSNPNNVYIQSENPLTSSTSTDLKIPTSWLPGHIITFQLANPEWDSTVTEKEYLKDKFIRFSYRFKYDDNEYSLMAPFTQPLFIPKQYGSFTIGDETNAAINTTVDWFENIVTACDFNIQLPNNAYGNTATTRHTASGLNFINRYRVKEIQILAKSSNDNNVYSIGEIELNVNQLQEQSDGGLLVDNSYNDWPYDSQILYEYNGQKPFQVLSESDVTRVSNATPVKNKAQEVAGNRVMYGNYQNSHAAPKSLNYECFVSPKNINNPGATIEEKVQSLDNASNPPIRPSAKTTIKENFNSTLKQGRTYQVGIILSDRYGRQSNVILADNKSFANSTNKDRSTVFAPYDGFGTSSAYSNFFGNSLKVIFYDEIPTTAPSLKFFPGLYNIYNNPLGWYSYKIVVKQQEQEYYNVYLPGALSGNVVYKNQVTALDYDEIYNTTNIALFGDNINKIPKDTANISPTDKVFGSNVLLKYRVSQSVYNARNIWNNGASVKGFYPVVSIQQYNDFGPWTNNSFNSSAAYPGGTSNPTEPFFKSGTNPFIASLDISKDESSRIGFAKSNQTANPPQISKFLMVAETNPVLSNIDIYWETTTSGLISELNTAIAEGDTPTSPLRTSPFLFLMEERYPYDGYGILPASTNNGKYLLQNDLKIITAGGLLSTNSAATMGVLVNGVRVPTTVTSVNGSNTFNLSPELFEIYQTATAGTGSATENAWNIRFNPAFAGTEAIARDKHYDPSDPWNSLSGNISFEIQIGIPGETPATRNLVFSNNSITNNEPEWRYLTTPSWNNTTVSPDPTDPTDVFDDYNSKRIFNQVIIDQKLINNSPFIPFTKDFIPVGANGPTGSTASDANARSWSDRKECCWTMSIRGKKNAAAGNEFIYGPGAYEGELGMMFRRENGSDWVTSRNGRDNSALRFNAYMVGLGNYGNYYSFQSKGEHEPEQSSNGFVDDMFDGMFNMDNNDNVEPYISKVELAKFDDNSYAGWTAGTTSNPTYGDQGATPMANGGWKDFLIVNDSQRGTTGPQASVNDPTISNNAAWGYREWPFLVQRLNSTNTANLIGPEVGGAFSNTFRNSPIPRPSSATLPTREEALANVQGRWCFLASRYNPPFCQFDEYNAGDFDSMGNLSGNEICVYRVTISLRETFSTGTGLLGDYNKVVYVKLVR